MDTRAILGLNSRNHLYTSKYNSKEGKRIANSKLETKKVLKLAGLRVPKTYGIVETLEQVEQFDFFSLPVTGFVIKPNNGLGGEGILVIDGPGTYAGEWVTSDFEIVTTDDLKLHVSDILQGRYSMDDLPDIAYIEELVRVDPAFLKYSYHGTPDIRIIVFNGVPVMAMLRLPTEESGGRANLFQGAVAVGIDIATGVTTYAIHHSKQITFLPGTRRRLRHIEIPQWDEILRIAVECQRVVKLGYLGVDIVLQPKNVEDKKLNKDKKISVPMVLELNAQPGLKIQLANMSGLWDRLRRVEGLQINNVKQGIRVGRALFIDPVLAEKGLGRKTIGVFEEIEIMSFQGERVKVKVKVDTGADSSSIDRDLADELGLLHPANLLYENYFKSALGRRKRQVVQGTFYLAGRKVATRLSVTRRTKMKYKMLIGRRDLGGYAVSPEVK